MKSVSVVLVFLTYISIYTQTLSGQVTDSLSKANLAYANLVIKNTKLGVYSNEDGSFNFDISNSSVSDTLVVSLIGYQQQNISLSDYKQTNNPSLNISLVPKTEPLTEVLIISNSKVFEKRDKQLSTGKRKHVFPTAIPFGYETATLIENTSSQRGKLVSIELKFKDSSSDMYQTYETYYRIGFYNVDDFGFPGELIYFENILIKPKQQTKNFKLNLDTQVIPFSKRGIFIGIETVKPEHVEITNSMYITTPSILHTHTEKQLKFTRLHSNSWSKHSRKSVFKKKFYAVPFIIAKAIYEKQ